jgi:ABC-type dipeptide/oligopeptide/nickel transport system permease component
MPPIARKALQAILKTLAVPALVTLIVWSAFHLVGGEIIRTYQGPGIAEWLWRVYSSFDFGFAGDWSTSGQRLLPFLFLALEKTGLIALTAISMATVFSIAWAYLAWNNPYNISVRGGSILIRFVSSWPILIGAILMAVLTKERTIATLVIPALILSVCDNNLNDFRDNLLDEINAVLKSDYAIAALGQGRSFVRNLLPEITWRVVSFIASRLPAIVSGIIVIELYFNINGIYGFLKMFYEAHVKDLNAILGLTFLASLFLTAWSSVFTVIHSMIDPRQR